MTDLKPCPFCSGGDVYYVNVNRNNPEGYIYCPDCGAEFRCKVLTRNDLIEKWNMRYLNGMPISLNNVYPRGEV